MALTNLFRTTRTKDLRLRLIHPTRAKRDTHTCPRVTLDGLQLYVGGHRRRVDPAPPTSWVAYHQAGALMYILWDAFADGENQALNANVTWPEPLRPRPRHRCRCGW